MSRNMKDNARFIYISYTKCYILCSDTNVQVLHNAVRYILLILCMILFTIIDFNFIIIFF